MAGKMSLKNGCLRNGVLWLLLFVQILFWGQMTLQLEGHVYDYIWGRKDLLLGVHVALKSLNLEISHSRLADYVNDFY